VKQYLFPPLIGILSTSIQVGHQKTTVNY